MQLPRWLLGRHVTSISIQAYVYDAVTGLASPYGSAASLVGCVEEISLELRVNNEDISPLTSFGIHEVPIGWGLELRLVEILRTGTPANILAEASAWVATVPNILYAVNFTRGVNAWGGFFFAGGYQEGIRRGKSVGTMSLKPLSFVSESGAYIGVPYNYVGYGAP